MQEMNTPDRLVRMQLPERKPLLGTSVGVAEREFGIFADGEELLNLTYADTKAHPAPEWVGEVLAEAIKHGESYTPYSGNSTVKVEVAKNVSGLLGVDVDPGRNLVLTPGTQAGLFETLGALIEAGMRVALPDPEYLSTERMLRFFGAQVEHFALTLNDGTATLDLDRLETLAADGVKLLVLSHPNNPTGAVYDDKTIHSVARIAMKYGLYVVADELYSRLVYDGRAFHHLAAVPGMEERTITLLGPSKTEQMSGFRLGTVVAPEAIAARVADIQSITALRAPAYSQHLLAHWIREDSEFLRNRVKSYQELRDVAYQGLSALDFVSVFKAQGTSYMFPDVSRLGRPDQEIAQLLAKHAQVIVNPGYQFGPRGIGSFRLCFAQDAKRWPSDVERICSVLSDINDGKI